MIPSAAISPESYFRAARSRRSEPGLPVWHGADRARGKAAVAHEMRVYHCAELPLTGHVSCRGVCGREVLACEPGVWQSWQPPLTVVLKGVQVAKSLQQLLSEERVQQLLDLSLVGRAQRRLADFCMVRGLQFLSVETPRAVNKVIAEVLVRAKSAHVRESTDLKKVVEDEQLFLEALMRRLAARSLLREFEFAPAAEQTDANVGAERLDDILTSLIEGMAGIGVKHIKITTEVLPGQVMIRLSSRQPITPVALGNRRFDLYDRTLCWLGGSLECSHHTGSAEFVIRLPALRSA